MSRVINEVDRGTRTVAGVEVHLVQLVWNDGGCSFDVYDAATGDDLTAGGSFEGMPTDEQIGALLRARQWWACPGCGRRVDDSQADLVVDHVQNCDLVDAAGNALLD